MSNKSNSRVVKDLVRIHILECIIDDNQSAKEALNEFNSQLKLNARGINRYNEVTQEVVNYTLQGTYKNFEFVDDNIRSFLNSLDLNNKSNKSFDSDDLWNMYSYLIFRELHYLNKMSDKQLKKYVK